MLHFKIKTCGVEGCKKPASYECTCINSRHFEDVGGWADPPPKEKCHPRYVCEQHTDWEPQKVKEPKMKTEHKITITLSKDDLLNYILQQNGMDIKDAVIDVEVEEYHDDNESIITWTELKGKIRVDVKSYAGADEIEMNSDTNVVDD